MSDSTTHNLLMGTADLSGCHYPTNYISVAEDPGIGFAVARLTPTTVSGGLKFSSQDVPESERVSEAAFCLSFLARADVDGDLIHSEVWGSRYALNTTLGTGWRLVTMPYGFVNANYSQVFFNGITGNSGAVYLAMPMANRGATPAAWAPAEGETLSGGGAQTSANLWSDSTASMQIRADGTYLVEKAGTAELTSNVTGLSSLTENQTVHMGASLTGPGAGVLKPFVEYKDAAGNLNWVGFPLWQPTNTWQRFNGTCVVPSGMTVCGVGFSNDAATGDIEVSNPVFCYGSTGIVMAAGSVTVASINDVASSTRYYLLQSSTLATPSAPTANPPGGSWAATEPTYTEGSTNSLYTCDETVFSDGTFAYSSVSLSSSYEAAKAAYNKAVAAAAAAAATDNHFWWGTDGAHVSSTGDHDLSGANLLLTSAKLAFRSALSELFSIVVSGTSAVISFLGGKFEFAYKANSSGVDEATISSPRGILVTSETSNTAEYHHTLTTEEGAEGLLPAGTILRGYANISPYDDLAGTHCQMLLDCKQTDGTENVVNVSLDTGCKLNGTQSEPQIYIGASTKDGSAADVSYDMTTTIRHLITAIQPVVLYNGGAVLYYDTAPGAGTTGTVTLSETAAHFREMTIFGKYDGYETSVTLTNPDGLGSVLQLFIPDAGPATRTYIKSRAIAISGTHITNTGWAAMWLSASTTHFDATSAPEIAVVRVEGRR